MNTSSALVVYAASMLLLSVNMSFLWAYSGFRRAKVKVSPNAEDVAKDGTLGADPPEVARVLRAHRNAIDNIVPFALVGLVYLLLGGSATVMALCCGVFVFARLLHSVTYLAGKQPWRTIAFAVGGLATGGLMVSVICELIARA